MIILRPGSGLCNRLRAIDSALKLARECKEALEIEWFRCPLKRWAAQCGMRVGFRDLFDPIEGVRVKEKIHVRNDFPWNVWRYSSNNQDFFGEERRGEFVESVKNGDKKLRWLWTCFNFYPSRDYTWLKPLPHLAARVQAEKGKWGGENCIGLHIRRTDNREAIKASPLSLFTERIESEIDRCEGVKFFVSSDDNATKDELKRRYGGRIKTLEAVSPRYTIRGEEDAVVDLMLLAGTSKIYGSYWSSFSEVASHIGKIPLEVLALKNVSVTPWIIQ